MIAVAIERHISHQKVSIAWALAGNSAVASCSVALARVGMCPTEPPPSCCPATIQCCACTPVVRKDNDNVLRATCMHACDDGMLEHHHGGNGFFGGESKLKGLSAASQTEETLW